MRAKIRQIKAQAESDSRVKLRDCEKQFQQVRTKLINDLDVAIRRVDTLEKQRDEQFESDAALIRQIKEMQVVLKEQDSFIQE